MSAVKDTMTAPLLSVLDLSVAFHQGGKESVAVDHVSFDIMPGEIVALVGESGSGKSVTANSILKLLPYPAASHPSGHILFEGKDLLNASIRELRAVRGNDITMIFQEPMTSLNPLHSIERQIGEILELHQAITGIEARKRTLELLLQVGIREPEKRLKAYPHELSGGQRQRVMIAMALANRPKLLIADEPTTALDVTVQAQILELLGDLKNQHDMSMLFITHDLGIVRKFADRVCVMTKGKIVETGTVEQVFTDPQHAYTRHLLAAEPKGEPPLSDSSKPVVMQGDDIKVWFPIKAGLMRKVVDHVKAVDGIDITLRAGQTVGVVGESGSGKTTLGLALSRLISSKGRISFIGQSIDGYSYAMMKPLRNRLQVVFQDPYGSLSPRMSVGEIIAEGLRVHEKSLSADERDRRVAQALDEVGLDTATRWRFPHEFSGGQRQRIAIARAMVLKPRFVMLDEPTSALDMSVQAQVVDLLRDLQAKHDLAYLFISHDLKVVKALANDMIVMRHGKVVESGPAKSIFEAPKEDYTRALMAAAFNIEAVKTAAISE
ncbi:ABC transporter ATP-binding protein [Agrobacterium rubi]|uniref:ABC transporter ATP-binding protein n=1 Tax=Agrobacterium rubi TaxID=28099 RepID=A0AAE7R2Y8_9HYPH|nr:ABC transporter ATP-binding protein [Agrobacterium rubi]NTE85127.1 ABC transporter ATP-binding protein [Agrobacterium rubi]NTF01059.1 ABC transporter ATP-binding protein [Agrobacterium rubi]NTF35247.1 ABC transporter ATP-binding protein [Agrobacterium rubi]OCJ48732.1 microcin ABC transporter ATP-binding protein [Agrobacterium rubi]QTG00451.1 ABC transporter ATP-binding protein [Agrobacterium rubi]